MTRAEEVQVTPHTTAQKSAVGPVAAIAAVVAVVLTALSGRYGFHRDELYFLVAGDHPDWGYVDQPPLTPLIAKLSTTLFGTTPTGLRVASTIMCVATVVVVALVARELAGGRPAQIIAAGCAATSGYVVAVGHMVSTSSFDVLAWVTIAWLAIRLLRSQDGRWWIPIGAAVGISMLNKNLVVLLAAALLIAVLAVGPRRVVRSWWFVAGIGVALVIAAPNIWWQAKHGWPQLTVAGGISGDDGTENRIMFVPLQVVYLSIAFVPIWIAGFVRLWRDRTVRSIAVAYLILAVLVLLMGGKSYYTLPLLIVLIAAGCEPVARWMRDQKQFPTIVAAIGISAIMTAIISLPVLPPSALSVVNAINQEQGEQVGWRALTGAAAAGWAQIPAEDRASAVIFTSNYGEAGAIARYAADYDLPAPYSGHMSFADWGPPPDSADGPVLLVYQDGGSALERYFTECREVGRVDNQQDVDNEEQNAVIALCSGTVEPWSTLWPDLRRFY